MSQNSQVTLFHSPKTRSAGALILLEELGIDYKLKVLNMKKGEENNPEYLAVNPMGKVPAILHRDTLVTEQASVYMYLADEFSHGKLAPAIGDPLRGSYLRWFVFYGSCFEPAIMDVAMKHPPVPAMMSPYGTFDTMLKTLTDQLEKGDYILGNRFSAADLLWGTALTWMAMFKLVPETDTIKRYTDRINARPAVARANAKDKELAAAQGE